MSNTNTEKITIMEELLTEIPFLNITRGIKQPRPIATFANPPDDAIKEGVRPWSRRTMLAI